MKTLKVVYLKSEYKSYSWNDGLFAIQKKDRDIVHLWKIKDGKLARYDDGTPVITCIGVNKKAIIPTELFINDYDSEESLENENDFNSGLTKEQEEKLKSIRMFEKITGQPWTNAIGETFFEYLKRGFDSMKNDKKKSFGVTEGPEKTNTKKVETPRPDVEPARQPDRESTSQKPKLDVTIENIIDLGYIKS